MQTPSVSTQTDKIGGMKVAKPLSNSYQVSASVSSDAVKSETATLGHNSFRPEVYRVSEGYVS